MNAENVKGIIQTTQTTQTIQTIGDIRALGEKPIILNINGFRFSGMCFKNKLSLAVLVQYVSKNNTILQQQVDTISLDITPFEDDFEVFCLFEAYLNNHNTDLIYILLSQVNTNKVMINGYDEYNINLYTFPKGNFIRVVHVSDPDQVVYYKTTSSEHQYLIEKYSKKMRNGTLREDIRSIYINTDWKVTF